MEGINLVGADITSTHTVYGPTEVDVDAVVEDVETEERIRIADEQAHKTVSAQRVGIKFSKKGTPSIPPPCVRGETVEWDYDDQTWYVVLDPKDLSKKRYGPPICGLVGGRTVWFNKGASRNRGGITKASRVTSDRFTHAKHLKKKTVALRLTTRFDGAATRSSSRAARVAEELLRASVVSRSERKSNSMEPTEYKG